MYQHSIVPAVRASDLLASYSNHGRPRQLPSLGQDFHVLIQAMWRSFILTVEPAGDLQWSGPGAKTKVHNRAQLERYRVNGTKLRNRMRDSAVSTCLLSSTFTSFSSHQRNSTLWPAVESSAG